MRQCTKSKIKCYALINISNAIENTVSANNWNTTKGKNNFSSITHYVHLVHSSWLFKTSESCF